MRRWLRSPIVHFVILGGILFAGRTAWERQSPDPQLARSPIVLSGSQIEQLQRNFEQRWGMPPSDEQGQVLIQQAIDDEILYQEARRLRLDAKDHSVRLRLIQKMQAISPNFSQNEEELYGQALALGLEDDVVIRRLLRQKMRLLLEEDPYPPSHQEVQAYVERHRDHFMQPATVTFSHIFLSARGRGDRLAKDAEHALRRLRSQFIRPDAISGLSDPFPLGPQLRGRSHSELARYFGARFADQIFALTSAKWSGPIASPFGLHLVWVHERVSENLPSLDTVWQQASYALLEERAARRRVQGLERLRRLYEIRIEVPKNMR
jgi:parvulin-like peptidyl-prolyl isomerase